MTKYTAIVSRGETYWVIHVPEVDCVTQAIRFREIEEMAKDLIKIMDGLPVEMIDLEVVLRTLEGE